MPELPEVEQARALIAERALGRAVLDPDLSALGPDAAEMGRAAFRERVGRGPAPLKARLMDQSVIAGVGNLLADETLWHAGLSPMQPVGDLGEEQLDRLRRALRLAIRRATRLGGVHTGELIPARHRGGSCPRCGSALGRATVGVAPRTGAPCTSRRSPDLDLRTRF